MDITLENGKKLKLIVVKQGDIYQYYVGNIRIGVYDPKTMEDHILFMQNTIENELSAQIKDGINSISKEEIQKEAEQNKKILEYTRERELTGIRDITIIDLEKKHENNTNKEERKNSMENSQQSDLNTEKTTTRDIMVKQEINLDERANDIKNIRQWLGANIPQEFTKLAVIESSQMENMKDDKGQSYERNSTRYSLAIIDKDGNIEPLQKYIPNLKQRDASGSNPTKLKYQVNKDGNVEKDAILSEYEIGSKVLQIDNKEMGRIQLNIGQEEHSGNETMGVQVRDSNSIYTTDTQTRAVLGEYESNGEYVVDRNIDEAEEHQKQNPDCDKMTEKDIDGNLQTTSHQHLENIDFKKLATKWGFYKDSGIPDEQKAKEILTSKIHEEPKKSLEEIIDKITDDFDDDFNSARTNR